MTEKKGEYSFSANVLEEAFEQLDEAGYLYDEVQPHEFTSSQMADVHGDTRKSWLRKLKQAAKDGLLNARRAKGREWAFSLIDSLEDLGG